MGKEVVPSPIPQQRLSILASMPATRNELVRMTGIAKSTVIRHIDRMHKAGDIHIMRSEIASNGNCIPVFDVGPSEDFIILRQKQMVRPIEPDLDYIEAKTKMDVYMQTVLAGPKANIFSPLGVPA